MHIIYFKKDVDIRGFITFLLFLQSIIDFNIKHHVIREHNQSHGVFLVSMTTNI